MYNIAFVLQKLSLKILEDEKSNLDDVIKAVNELEIAQRCDKIKKNVKTLI